MRSIIMTILLTASVASANEQHKTASLGTLLDEVAMNGAAPTRTFYIGPLADCGINNSCDPTSSTGEPEGEQVRGFSLLALEFYFTHVNDGTITTTCTAGDTRATATLTLTTGSLSSGTLTLAWSGVAVTPTISGDKDWPLVMSLQGHRVYKCVVAHGGAPAAGDLLTVKGKIEAE